MNRRTRSASASSRIPKARSGRPLEAHEPPHEGVVPRMRCVTVPGGEKGIEALLGHRNRPANREPETAQARSPDRNDQGLDGLDLPLEVANPGRDELVAGKPQDRVTFQ